MKNAIEKAFCAAVLALILWIGGSFAEIGCKNLNPDPQYSQLNAFVLLVENVQPVKGE